MKSWVRNYNTIVYQKFEAINFSRFKVYASRNDKWNQMEMSIANSNWNKN